MTLKKMMAAGLLLLLVAACGGAKKEQHGAGQTDATDAERTERLKPRYAEGFSLRSEGGVWLVDIQDPQKEDEEGDLGGGLVAGGVDDGGGCLPLCLRAARQ